MEENGMRVEEAYIISLRRTVTSKRWILPE